MTQWDFIDTKNISGTIAPKNDAPEITDENTEFSLKESEVLTIDLLDHYYDVDKDDILSFILPEGLDAKNFSLDGNILTVTNPWVNADILNEFKIAAVDLAGESVEKDFSITFKNNINEGPVWNADDFEMQEDGSQLVNVLANDTDVDWDTITISSVSNVENASLEIIDNKIKVTPDANYFGPISFTYTPVSNGVEWNVTTVSWNVLAVDDVPEVLLATKTVKLVEWEVNGQEITTVELFDDIDSTFTYSIESQFADIDEQTWEITLKNVDKQSSWFDIVVTATADGKSVQSTIKVEIENTDDATVTNPDSITINEDSGEHTVDVLANDSDADNELKIRWIGYESWWILAQIVDNKIKITTLENVFGETQIQYTTNTWATETLTVIVNAVNDAPVATSLSSTYTIWEWSSIEINLDPHYTDIDNQVLWYAVQSGLDSGDYSINGNILTITNPWVTQDVLKNVVIQAVDAWGLTVQKDFDITFSNTANEAPVINNFSPITSINEAETKSFTFEISDANWDNLTATLNNAPDFITLNQELNTFTVTLEPWYEASGTYEDISVSVSDGTVSITSDVFNLEVSNVDRPLQAENKSITLTEWAVNGKTFDVTGLFNDPDGSAISYVLVSNLNADLSGNILTFKDVWENFYGELTFDIIGTSGGVEKTATLTINVNAVNDAPVATFDSFSTNEDSPFNGQLTATDLDGDTLSYWVKTAAQNGAVTVNSDGTFTYTPNENFNGTDTFEYEVSDGQSTDTKVVNITVNAINDAPVIKNTSVTTVEDAEYVNLPVDITYVDSTSHTYTSFSADHGEVWVTWENTLRYKPEKDYFGNDVAKYEITDNNGLKSTWEVAIKILNHLDAPVATFDNFSVNEDEIFNGQLTATDIDSENLTFSRIQQAENGTVTINSDGSFTYTPNENFNGTDTFEYKVSDGIKSANQVVTVTVNAINDAPEATDLSSTFSINEWHSLEINLDNHIFDVDNEVLWFSVESGLDSGDYSINGNMLTVTNPWVTQDTLKNVVVKAVDLAGESAEKDFSITFKNNVNENVEFSNFNPITSIAEWETKSFTFNYDDPNGDDVTLSLKLGLNDAPDFATLVDNKDGSATVTFAPWYDDADTYMNFVVEAIEPNGDRTSTAWFHLTVENTNRAPVITSSASFSTNEDTPYNGVITATDADNDTLTYSVSMQPEHGDISLDSSTWEYTYTPDEDYHWADYIEFSAFDGVATVTKKITLDVNSIIDDYELVDGNFPTTAKEGDLYSHTFTLKDVDSVVNNVTIVNKPDWMTLNNLWAGEYSMTGTPDYDAAGTYENVTISINGKNEVVQNIVVENTILTPTISMKDQFIDDGYGFYTIELPAPDVENVEPWAVYEIVWDTTWGKLTIDSSTWVASRFWDAFWPADYLITIKVTNPGWKNNSVTFKLNVRDIW